jgi:5-(carboxyamino)imidazole ribonucleotide synthase
MRPGLDVFETVQNRINEKSFLARHGIPCAPFAVIQTRDELETAVTQLGTPCVLKTSAGGYDGKGQVVIRAAEQAEAAWREIGEQPATLEAWVPLSQEVSVLVARDVFGQIATFGPVENVHTNHILDWSVVPARVDPGIAKQSLELAEAVALHLNLTGLICIEFFVSTSGQVLVNEIAPRPHNSGHLTIESAVTCQFEQQLRTVCGLPVGSFASICPAAMVNLLGDVWQDGPPQWPRMAEIPATYLHLYDKHQPKPGRKMGHITSLANSPEQALENARLAKLRLKP